MLEEQGCFVLMEAWLYIKPSLPDVGRRVWPTSDPVDSDLGYQSPDTVADGLNHMGLCYPGMIFDRFHSSCLFPILIYSYLFIPIVLQSHIQEYSSGHAIS